MNMEQRILNIHPYQITKPKDEKGRWQTYVKRDGDDKRKIIRAPSYDSLLEKLFDFYYNDTQSHVFTMQQLFNEWLLYKESITNSSSTIRRHEQHWKKYFSAWNDEKVNVFDKLELQKRCNLLVKENNLSSKEWQNVKTVLSGMFSYAYEKGYTKNNPMSLVKITVKYRQVNKKTGKTETFLTDEYKTIMVYLDEQYMQTSDTVYLALKLDFFVGFRVGELSALKWKDVLDINHLHICREEIKKTVRIDGHWHDTYEVVEHTKTHTDRIIALVPPAVVVVNELRLSSPCVSDDGYIFVRNGQRITSRQITYALEKACKHLNIPVKRTHKIRKTVASLLNAGGVPVDAIREFLGHSNIDTTNGYIFNPLSEKETYKLMSKAL